MIRVRSAALVLGVVVGVALGTAGCGGADDGASPSAGTGAASASPSEPVADADLGSATATLEDGTVDVVVRSLERDPNGTTMTLRVAFTPHLGLDEAKSLSSMNNYWFIHPVLLDRENLKRYSVIEGEGPQDWLTNDDATTTEGEPLESWFVFAAPEDPVGSMAVTLDAWGVEIPDVPITDGAS